MSGTNDIGKFQRLPSDLRRYLEYMFYLKQKYGSIMDFVVSERLHWDQEGGLKPRGGPFEYDGTSLLFTWRCHLANGPMSIDDLKILFNDWPYGLEEGIVHLVIWTKFELEDDPATGLLTESMWKKIDDYVERVFRSRMPADQVSPLLPRYWSAIRCTVLNIGLGVGCVVQELEVSQVYTCD